MQTFSQSDIVFLAHLSSLSIYAYKLVIPHLDRVVVISTQSNPMYIRTEEVEDDTSDSFGFRYYPLERANEACWLPLRPPTTHHQFTGLIRRVTRILSRPDRYEYPVKFEISSYPLSRSLVSFVKLMAVDEYPIEVEGFKPPYFSWEYRRTGRDISAYANVTKEHLLSMLAFAELLAGGS